MYGQVRADVREIIATLCNYKGIEIVEGAVCADHVHLCVSVPPKISISNFMGYLKGKSTLMIYDRHKLKRNGYIDYEVRDKRYYKIEPKAISKFFEA